MAGRLGQRTGFQGRGSSGGSSPIDIDINGEAFLSGVTTNQDIPVVDQDGGEVGEPDGTDWLVYRYPYRDQWKSGATTSYVAGDDGDLQEGAGASFTTLEANQLNVFGTTDRFTDELGGTTYAKDIVIDHSTFNILSGTHGGARAYYRVLYSGVNMDFSGGVPTAISACQGTSITGFTIGWEMVNAPQIFSLIDHENAGTANGLNYSPFNHVINSSANTIWTCTISGASNAIRLNTNSIFQSASYTASSRAMATRWVYWNPATQEFQATAP